MLLRAFTYIKYSTYVRIPMEELRGWWAPPMKQNKITMRTLRLLLSGLLIVIICLSAVVFSNIASGSLVSTLGAVLGAAMAVLMVHYFDSRRK